MPVLFHSADMYLIKVKGLISCLQPCNKTIAQPSVKGPRRIIEKEFLTTCLPGPWIVPFAVALLFGSSIPGMAPPSCNSNRRSGSVRTGDRGHPVLAQWSRGRTSSRAGRARRRGTLPVRGPLLNSRRPENPWKVAHRQSRHHRRHHRSADRANLRPSVQRRTAREPMTLRRLGDQTCADQRAGCILRLSLCSTRRLLGGEGWHWGAQAMRGHRSGGHVTAAQACPRNLNRASRRRGLRNTSARPHG